MNSYYYYILVEPGKKKTNFYKKREKTKKNCKFADLIMKFTVFTIFSGFLKSDSRFS